MKHLTKQEAIGRMMLAYATLIEENFQCELMWYRSFEQCVLKIYAKKSGEDPHLPFLTHSDFKSVKRNLKQCVLENYAKKSGEDPHLPFLTHSDFNYEPAPRGCFSC